MEAPKPVLPGEVHRVRNSSPAIAGLETERGIISNGVNNNSYCALGSAPCRPVRRYGLSLSIACPPKVECPVGRPARRSFSVGGTFQHFPLQTQKKYGKGRDGDDSIDLSRLLRYERRKGKKILLLREGYFFLLKGAF